jgi:hypothetical protein
VDAEQVRAEIRQTRASIDRKLELLSGRTSELADAAKDTLWCTFAATLVTVGATVAVTWLRRHA